jgi:hypothetical protein
VHLESLKGADKIAIPKPGSDAAIMRAEVFEKLGLPKEEKDYQLKIKEGLQVNPEFQKSFQQAAYQNNILPAQGEAMLNWFADLSKQAHATTAQEMVDRQKAGLTALQSEWGQTYNDEMAKAKAAVKEFLSPEEQALFKGMGLSTEPAFIKLMNRLGSTLSEGQIKGPNGEGGAGRMTPQEAQAAIDAIKKDPSHAYYNAKHADHAAAKKEMNRLYEMRFPKPPAQK